MLSYLIRIHRIEYIVLVEPKVSGEGVNKIISKIKFDCSHRIEARGFLGRI